MNEYKTIDRLSYADTTPSKDIIEDAIIFFRRDGIRCYKEPEPAPILSQKEPRPRNMAYVDFGKMVGMPGYQAEIIFNSIIYDTTGVLSDMMREVMLMAKLMYQGDDIANIELAFKRQYDSAAKTFEEMSRKWDEELKRRAECVDNDFKFIVNSALDRAKTVDRTKKLDIGTAAIIIGVYLFYKSNNLVKQVPGTLDHSNVWKYYDVIDWSLLEGQDDRSLQSIFANAKGAYIHIKNHTNISEIEPAISEE